MPPCWIRANSCIRFLPVMKKSARSETAREVQVQQRPVFPAHLPDAVLEELVHWEASFRIDGLNPQLPQKLFQVGFVDERFLGRLAVGRGLNRAFIKSL